MYSTTLWCCGVWLESTSLPKFKNTLKLDNSQYRARHWSGSPPSKSSTPTATGSPTRNSANRSLSRWCRYQWDQCRGQGKSLPPLRPVEAMVCGSLHVLLMEEGAHLIWSKEKKAHNGQTQWHGRVAQLTVNQRESKPQNAELQLHLYSVVSDELPKFGNGGYTIWLRGVLEVSIEYEWNISQEYHALVPTTDSAAW